MSALDVTGVWEKSQVTYTMQLIPVDNFGTVVGENPTPYGILALWFVNGLSVVYWDTYANPIVVSVPSATGRAYTMVHHTEWWYNV